MTEIFTDAERRVLQEHFSNVDGDVFTIITPSQTDRGALMSRYSRSAKSMRRIFLDEFANNPLRGQQFYDRVLSQYGDDSVAELGQVQLGIEGISNIAIQTVEDRRVGMSFLEKSSRYVSWVSEENGQYAYYRGADIMESRHEKTYENVCNFSFETYAKNIKPVTEYICDTHPIENYSFIDSDDKTKKKFPRLRQEQDIKMAQNIHKRTVRSMALDVLRYLLPASTLTNVGISGNGRSFEYLINILKSSDIHEERNLGTKIATELNETLGPFVKRSLGRYGKDQQEYMEKIEKESIKYATAYGGQRNPGVRMIECEDEKNALNKVVAGLLYDQSGQNFEALLKITELMPKEKKRHIIESFTEIRQHRRHRPGRAFELTSYLFDLVINYGIYRDLHRHRIASMQRQKLSTNYGFIVPQIIDDAGVGTDFCECMKSTKDAYDKMVKTMPNRAQYVVNFAFNYPFIVRANLREMCHIIELRTIPAGHQDYRYVAQEMYNQISQGHPTLAGIIKFVNMNGYDMGRMNAEIRSEKRLAQTEEKVE